MTVGELLITNKEKYTKVFLIENDEENRAKFTQVSDATIDKEQIYQEAKDYFLLDKVGIDEIFGNAEDLGVVEEDKVLIIGI